MSSSLIYVFLYFDTKKDIKKRQSGPLQTRLYVIRPKTRDESAPSLTDSMLKALD